MCRMKSNLKTWAHRDLLRKDIYSVKLRRFTDSFVGWKHLGPSYNFVVRLALECHVALIAKFTGALGAQIKRLCLECTPSSTLVSFVAFAAEKWQVYWTNHCVRLCEVTIKATFEGEAESSQPWIEELDCLSKCWLVNIQPCLASGLTQELSGSG